MGPKELLPRSGAKVWEIFLKCLYGGVRQSGTKGGVVGKLWGGRGGKMSYLHGRGGQGGTQKAELPWRTGAGRQAVGGGFGSNTLPQRSFFSSFSCVRGVRAPPCTFCTSFFISCFTSSFCISFFTSFCTTTPPHTTVSLTLSDGREKTGLTVEVEEEGTTASGHTVVGE